MSTFFPPLGTPRECCDSKTGDVHRACEEMGTNAQGVTLCACRPYGPVHVYEPGEACSPSRMNPRVTVTGGKPDPDRVLRER